MISKTAKTAKTEKQNMTYNLFIDDERNPIHVKWGSWQDQALYRDDEWIIARNWNEVLELVVSLGFPNMISFDHDLGDDEITGYEIAQKLANMVMDGTAELPAGFEFRVHSKNPVGGENIRRYMENFLKHME
jgi:hypothetical protein